MDLTQLSRTELIHLMTAARRELRENRRWFETSRPDWDAYWSFIAYAVSLRGACARRKVGVVFVSEDQQLLSTGYNGREPGVTNCIDSPCDGVGTYIGHKMPSCQATHAEVNAEKRYRQLGPGAAPIHTVYTTATPCSNCIQVLLKTTAKRIVYSDEHVDAGNSKNDWTEGGREWVYFKD